MHDKGLAGDWFLAFVREDTPVVGQLPPIVP